MNTLTQAMITWGLAMLAISMTGLGFLINHIRFSRKNREEKETKQNSLINALRENLTELTAIQKSQEKNTERLEKWVKDINDEVKDIGKDLAILKNGK